MMIYIIKFFVAFLYLLVSSIKDIKSREVWNWLSYTLIALGFSLNAFFSVFYMDSSFILGSLAGFFAAMGFSFLMYFSGQWGGGDAKVLMGLGALLGIPLSLAPGEHLLSLSFFLLCSIFAGAFYGMAWVTYTVLKNRKAFAREYNKLAKKYSKLRKVILTACLFLVLMSLFLPISLRYYVAGSALMCLFVFLLYLSLKNLESVAMLKKIPVSRLTEGDWVKEEIRAKRKGMSYLDYIIYKQYDNLDSISYIYTLYYRLLRLIPLGKNRPENPKEFQRQRIAKRLAKELRLSVKDIEAKGYTQVSEKAKKKMKENGFLVDSDEIVVCGTGDLGLLNSQIAMLKKLFGSSYTLKVKEGMPFLPSFLLALVFQIIAYYIIATVPGLFLLFP
jgi:Flp pilus assembly protein protease CpaA